MTTDWGERFDHGTPDGYQFFLDLGPLKNVNDRYFENGIPFWDAMAAHPNHDEFWQSRNLLPHLLPLMPTQLVLQLLANRFAEAFGCLEVAEVTEQFGSQFGHLEPFQVEQLEFHGDGLAT